MPRTSLTALALCFARSAHACVTCDSPTACQVRRGIFDTHFLHTLLLTAAPVPLMLAAAVLILFRFPLPGRQTEC